MLRLIICGINGTMGTLLYNQAINRGHHVVCGIDKLTVGKTECPVYKDIDQTNEHADAIIDFSSPSILSSLLTYSTANKTPLVLCSTGYSANEENLIKQASKKIPIFKSANTSTGIMHFTQLCQHLAKCLKDFDVEIIEKHHKHKKDSPSGTAKLIADNITNQIKSISIENSKQKAPHIDIHSIRGGSIVGEHSVLFLGEYDSFTLTHTAHSKLLFANGALDACEYLTTKPNGLYNIDNLYFSNEISDN